MIILLVRPGYDPARCVRIRVPQKFDLVVTLEEAKQIA
jgi:hypothetical protein